MDHLPTEPNYPQGYGHCRSGEGPRAPGWFHDYYRGRSFEKARNMGKRVIWGWGLTVKNLAKVILSYSIVLLIFRLEPCLLAEYRDWITQTPLILCMYDTVHRAG